MVEISLAPMMKITTPAFRILMRMLSPTTLLFTEMIVSATVVNMPTEKLLLALGTPEENTVVQVGGSNPQEVAQAVLVLKKLGWTAFNLNCGCPSNRVKSGKFGAVLMLDKQNVADIINETHKLTGCVLSLKIRTGVDNNDSYEWLNDFVGFISSTTRCTRFYCHARKCWLNGLSPKQNRSIPVLNYDYVYRLKEDFPSLFISLNGSIKGDDLGKLRNLDGLMIGRHSWEEITVFSKYENVDVNMKEVIREYIEVTSRKGVPKHKILMPLINYRKGRPGTSLFKQRINEILHSEIESGQIYCKIEEFID